MSGALRILSSMAPREVLEGTAALYGERFGRDVHLESAGGVDVARRVGTGEAVDLVVLAGDAIDKLIGNGSVLTAGRTALMTSVIAVGVRSGSAHPPMNSETDVRDLVLGARSLSFSTGPSGTYLEKLFDRWGILQQLRPRIVVPPPGVPVASLISAGEGTLGFQQLSELVDVPGVDVLGVLPPAIQHTTTFTAGITAVCKDLEAAGHFLEFAASAATDAIKRRHGMTPLL